jgi:DNA-binding NarL/FixJ family response regulator
MSVYEDKFGLISDHSVPNMETSEFTAEDGWELITVFEDGERISEALRAGAVVFLVKSRGHNQLRKSTSVGDNRNRSTVIPAIELQTMNTFRLIRLTSAKLKCLSPREAEVLELLALGFLYREISEKLNIGMETVRTHVKGIRSKMQVRNRIEAVANYKAKSDLSMFS